MADVDEDHIPSLDPTTPSQTHSILVDDASDSDASSDAAPDYRFLGSTTASRSHSLPTRGIKDFEPTSTARQASSLDASRQAMVDALSVTRVHTTRRNENVGVYFSDPADWDGQRYEEAALARIVDAGKRAKVREGSVLKSGEGRSVAVERFSSTYARTMGKSDRRNWTWLLPEEALFLLERGSLDVRYAEEGGAEEDAQQDGQSDDEEVPQLNIGDVPMSLQGAYAAFIGKSGLTLERYVVYANLKRGGYIVQRAPTWSGPWAKPAQVLIEQSEEANTMSTSTLPPASTSLILRLVSWLTTPTSKPSSVPCYNTVSGPLITPGLFRSYGDIFRQLQIIPQHDTKTLTSTAPSTFDANTDLPLLPTYHVTKPSAIQGYKKSSPPPPHYTVVVLDARHTRIPTSTQIGDLLASQPDDHLENAQRKRLETRIKHGKRSVLLAVVDSGLVSYLRFSGGGFGAGESLWEENEKRAKQSGGSKGKRGGGGAGRGRGRGRGRGGARSG